MKYGMATLLVARAAASSGEAARLPDPAVARVVEKMQAFYEGTSDFEARFEQTYLYKAFGRTQRSSGRVRFAKPALMRWDYERPAAKVFVIAKAKVYVWDPEAKTLHVSGFATDRLSTSITFLWGRGRLSEEFDIRRAVRSDLGDGIALELTPRKPDPRFTRVYFVVDAKTHAVRATLVVDPDGSENRMDFADVKVNPGIPRDDFALNPPEGTQVIKLP